jgi:hypothetical protein
MSELNNARYEDGSTPFSKPNGSGGVGPQPQPETGAEISAPTSTTKIKTVSQPEESASSSKIKTLSPALVKAMNAKKGFSAPVGKRVQATYPLQKPPKNKFVRVHLSPEYRMNGVLTLTDVDTGEIYYVSPDLDLPPFIESQTRVTDLYAAQMSDGSIFIWPLHRSETSWYRAAKAAIRIAVSKWVAVVARRAANTYDLVEPEDSIPEPEWSSLPSFEAMLESAFEDHMVTSLDHPFLRKLRGFREDGDDE